MIDSRAFCPAFQYIGAVGYARFAYLVHHKEAVV